MSDSEHSAEVARIEAAYRERDATGIERRYRYVNTGYAFYMQLLEWALLDAFRRAPIRLERARVLDIGCGTGYFVNRISEFGAQATTGVDLSPERVEEARKRYPANRFVCANAAELPFADGEFDVVAQFVCLSSVVDPGLRRAIGAEMWRVLRPGGIVLSYDMRPEPWPLRLRRWRRTRRLRGQLGPNTPMVPISPQELQRLFPARALEYRTVGLDFELCSLSIRSQLGALMLAAMPPLRAHAIGIVTKA
jgi:SAM-dependent methyltransferase